MALVQPALTQEVICEWKVENFILIPNEEELFSPIFNLNPGNKLIGSEWWLSLSLKDAKSRTTSICLHRATGDGPETIKLCYEISIIAMGGSSRRMLSSPLQSSFKKGSSGDLIEICGHGINDNAFRVNLTLRCRMWGVDITYPMYWLICTWNQIQKWYFKWNIDRFSFLKQEHCILRYSFEHALPLQLQVSWSGDGLSDKIQIQISRYEPEEDLYAICTIYVLDADGNVAASKRDGIFLKGNVIWRLPPFITKEWLLQNKDMCLPNDSLSLRFEVETLANNEHFEKVEEIHFGGLNDLSSITPGCSTSTIKRTPTSGSCTEGTGEVVMQVDPSGSSINMHDSNSLMKGLLSLYQERKFCDVTLKSDASSFPVHKAVLCAQSPVFTALIEQDMKEKKSGLVDVPDMDDDTIQRMLMFMYTDNLPDIQWGSVQKLYIASDKYEISRLKNLCRSFLKTNINVWNVIEALVLADLHQDADLESASLDFIYEHDCELINSDLWKSFMQEHLKLAAEIMHLLYMKKMKM